MTQLAAQVHRRLWVEHAGDSPTPDDLGTQIRALAGEFEPLATTAMLDAVEAEVRARIDGLGPLYELGLDPSVTEIMVNGDESVWVERSGALTRTDLRIDAEQAVHLARRLASAAGRRIDVAHPTVDVRMLDGSRLHAIIPPLAVDGPCITIRRFGRQELELSDLAESPAADVLERAVSARETIVVAGATSSGKTTLLNALGSLLPPNERVVTIEDAAELRLPGNHVVRLETRPATEATTAVGLRELTRHALRMRPDRIVCGEMRGSEALDLIQAMNTGHRGSLSTVHANSAPDGMRRIETMMLLGDAELPLVAIREQLASCIDLVVMMVRAPDGRRLVDSIHRVPAEPTPGWALDCEFQR